MSELDTLSVTATCADINLNDIPCTEFVPATSVAKLKCKEGYQEPNYHFNNRLVCRRDGRWGGPIPSCEPRCGEFITEDPIIPGLNNTSLPQAPWHVVIYKNQNLRYKQICGGTIISTRAVLSAAQCFWDEATVKLNPAFLYSVVAGKTDYSYSEQNTQSFQVESILVPDGYLGSANYFVGDIALVKLSRSIIYKNSIVPICIAEGVSEVDLFIERLC